MLIDWETKKSNFIDDVDVFHISTTHKKKLIIISGYIFGYEDL
jgi:hypothetical protein